MATTTCKYIN